MRQRRDDLLRHLTRPLPRRAGLLAVVIACAVPVQAWLDRGALFGIVALLTFPPMVILGAFAHEWLLRPRPPGPRYLAPLGPLLIVPLAFVAAGLSTNWPPLTCLLLGLAIYAPLAVLGVVRHPGR